MSNAILKNVLASGGSVPFLLPNPYGTTGTYGLVFVKKLQSLQPFKAKSSKEKNFSLDKVHLNASVYRNDVPDPLFLLGERILADPRTDDTAHLRKSFRLI